MRIPELKSRFFAVDVLKILKKSYTYDSLGKVMQISPPVLSRYINDHNLPNDAKTERILAIFKERYLADLLRMKVKVGKDGRHDLSPLHYDSKMQKLIARMFFHEFIQQQPREREARVTKILTAAVDGIPIATRLGNEFECDVVYAKKSREGSMGDNVSAKRRNRESFRGHFRGRFYVPKGSIRPNDAVLIVDDIVRTGDTIDALIRIVGKSGAKTAGIFTIFSVGDVLDRFRTHDVPAKCFMRFDRTS